MLWQGRHPDRGVGWIAHENLVAAHDAVFHLINPHQPTKLVGLVPFPFAYHFGVRFEQTQHLALRAAVAAQYSLQLASSVELGAHRFHHPRHEDTEGVGEGQFIHLGQCKDAPGKSPA